jgi:phenol 2-monooxygenase
MTVPREKQLVRLYIELQEADTETIRKPSEYSLEDLFDIAEKIMKPYKLRSNYCDWWSIYPASQAALSLQFWWLTKDRSANVLSKTFGLMSGKRDKLVTNFALIRCRVFLTGDAAHTHSPKGGQGMNVSIQDTYNLTWKLGSVITGVARPCILDTFEPERRPVAEKLMKLDQQLVQAYVAGSDNQNLVEQVRSQSAGFMSGVEITYHPNVLIQSGDNDGNNACAEHVRLGMRLLSSPVISQRDGSCVHLGDMLTSDGSWKLLVFPGDISTPNKMAELSRFIHTFARQSTLFPEAGRSGKGVPALELIVIHSTPRSSVKYVDLPCLFHPPNNVSCQASKVFADDGTSGGETGLAYKSYGINEHRGCLILCRPDQHVAWTGAMEDLDSLHSYFSRFSVGSVPSSQNSEN